jgi:ketosteroid isomerase-like protein
VTATIPGVPDEDFELVRRVWSAAGRADPESMRPDLHPDIVAVPFGAALEGKAYRGPDEVVGWFRDEILSTWEVFQVIPQEFQRVGDRILVTGRWKARGIESGVELDIPATWVLGVLDGKIVYWHTYTNHEDALRDVGLDG